MTDACAMAIPSSWHSGLQSTEKGPQEMTKPIDADHDDMVEIRKYAQSIAAAVAELDNTDIHPSWQQQGTPGYHPAVIDYLGHIADLLQNADEEIWAAIESLKEVYS